MAGVGVGERSGLWAYPVLVLPGWHIEDASGWPRKVRGVASIERLRVAGNAARENEAESATVACTREPSADPLGLTGPGSSVPWPCGHGHHKLTAHSGRDFWVSRRHVVCGRVLRSCDSWTFPSPLERRIFAPTGVGHLGERGGTGWKWLSASNSATRTRG